MCMCVQSYVSGSVCEPVWRNKEQPGREATWYSAHILHTYIRICATSTDFPPKRGIYFSLHSHLTVQVALILLVCMKTLDSA